MKKIAIILSCMIIALTVQGQKKKEIKADKIKSITTWAAENKKGNTVTYKDCYEEFDINGNSILKIEYNKKGVIKHKEASVYNANGKKTEDAEYDLKDNKNVKRTYQFTGNVKTDCLEYDSNGTLIKKISYTRDANGKKSGETITDAAGNLTKKITEEYNKNGKKTIRTETGKDGTIKHKETYTYDANGKVAEETEFDLKDNVNIKKSYKYNAYKDKTEEVEYNNVSGAVIKKTIYAYNADGSRTSEIVSDASGALIKKILFTYNSKKLKETKQTYSASGILEIGKKYIYEYF
jgi:hypothetical protein